MRNRLEVEQSSDGDLKLKAEGKNGIAAAERFLSIRAKGSNREFKGCLMSRPVLGLFASWIARIFLDYFFH